MSRDPYRGGRDDFGYGGGRGGGGNRWDSERFAAERRGPDREFFEERDTRVTSRGGGYGRPRERSVDEIYERRGPRYHDDRFERRHYHDDDGPRFEREIPFRDRGNSTSVTVEKERVYSPSPPRRGGNRPAFLRRQSSLDTFDRKPLTRYVDREEYGPPARYRPDVRPPPLVPIPLPKARQLGPPPSRRYERDYEDIRVAEPDFYGDDEFRGYPERVREREIVRRRRRSRSRESRSHRGSVRSSSISSSSSSDRETVRNEFPKRGKTRMPARLVSKKAIIDLGYPFEEEGDVIIIQKALGRENIDEVIKLSEDYKNDERVIETEHTTYLVGPGAEISGGRSDAGTTVFEERQTQQVFNVPPPPNNWIPPPPNNWVPPPPPAPVQEVITDTKIVERHDHGHNHGHQQPVIIDAGRPHHHHDATVVDIRETQYVDRSESMPVGPLALALPPERSRPKDERAIRAEIRALEAEKEALRAEKRADRELRKAERLRGGGRASEGDLVLYDERIDTRNEDVTIVRRERIEEPDGGVRIEKDRKAAPPPRVIRAMLKTLT